MLCLHNVSVSYDKIPALRGVSLEVASGEIVALIGANGAGKSTLLKAISRLLPLSAGTIRLGARDVTRAGPADVVGLGMAHVPEGRRVFREMSVEENLQMGAYWRRRDISLKAELDGIYTLFPILRERRNGMADTLSGGEQQMLAIGRALMARPKLMLLDEPSMGLAPRLVQTIFEIIAQIRARGTTILLVEQNAARALAVAQRAYVIEAGRIVLSGTGADLASDARVREAYLGRQRNDG